MATRKDLLKAQSFTSRRMLAAFVDRDPDDPTPPLRRVGTATFVSVLLGVILLAGVGLLGFIGQNVGGASWKEPGTVIADTQSVALFVYDGESLVPMADIAAAKLKAGQLAEGVPRVVNVKTEQLRGTPQKQMYGIPGAPRQLPPSNGMRGAPVRLCSTKPRGTQRFLTLQFDAPAPKEEPVSIVAEHDNGTQYLITGGKAHELWREQGKRSPIVDHLPVVKPGNGWISAIPLGEPVEPLDIDNAGTEPAKNVLNLEVGHVVQVKAPGEPEPRYYVQRSNGLERISYLHMRLQQAKNGQKEPQEISSTELTDAGELENTSPTDIPLGRPKAPDGDPQLGDVSVCATYDSSTRGRVTLSIDQDTPQPPETLTTPTGLTDHIGLASLSGALLRADDGDDASPTLLILDGKGYPIPDKVSREHLGYGEATPAPVPATLLKLIPPGLEGTGNNLSAASVKPVTG